MTTATIATKAKATNTIAIIFVFSFVAPVATSAIACSLAISGPTTVAAETMSNTSEAHLIHQPLPETHARATAITSSTITSSTITSSTITSSTITSSTITSVIVTHALVLSTMTPAAHAMAPARVAVLTIPAEAMSGTVAQMMTSEASKTW
jgi:hypothetical protein